MRSMRLAIFLNNLAELVCKYACFNSLTIVVSNSIKNGVLISCTNSMTPCRRLAFERFVFVPVDSNFVHADSISQHTH